MKFDKLIVVFCIGVILAFTCYVCYINFTGGEVSDTLIENVYDFFGVELVALAGIKISKRAKDVIETLRREG